MLPPLLMLMVLLPDTWGKMAAPPVAEIMPPLLIVDGAAARSTNGVSRMASAGRRNIAGRHDVAGTGIGDEQCAANAADAAPAVDHAAVAGVSDVAAGSNEFQRSQRLGDGGGDLTVPALLTLRELPKRGTSKLSPKPSTVAPGEMTPDTDVTRGAAGQIVVAGV